MTIAEAKPTFVGDMKKLAKGVKNILSKADISIKVNNIEVKKDLQNNMEFSMMKENTKTGIKIKNDGAISISTNINE